MIALWLVGAALASSVEEAPAAANTLPGEWHLAVTDKEARQVIDAAIDEAAQQFSILVRAIAKSRLREVAFFCHRIAVIDEPARFGTDCRDDDKEGVVASWSGEPTEGVSPIDGQPYVASVTRIDGSPTLSLQNTTGERRSTYTLTESGMSLRVRVFSEKLDSPLTWTLPYTRGP